MAPAISAGVLPLVMGIGSWWYPPSILLGTCVLALLSQSMLPTKPNSGLGAIALAFALDS